MKLRYLLAAGLLFSASVAHAALPYIFANQAGNLPAATLDSNFNAIDAMGITQCTATGTDSIALAQNANQTTVAGYVNYQQFGFVAAGTSAGTVTININAVGAKPLYLPDSVTQAGSGDIRGGVFYVIAYNSALNSALGGFQMTSLGGTAVTPGSYTSANITVNGAGQITAAANGAGTAGVVTVTKQVITATGTYTPHAGLLFAEVEIGGAGGGGGMASAGGVGGGGGGGSGYGRSILTAATIGVSQTVTIGTGGAGGVSNGNGSVGGTSSFGAIISCTGGTGGAGGAGATEKLGGQSGVCTGADLNVPGGYGYNGNTGIGGNGGSTSFGGGGRGASATNSVVGQAYGSGGGGCNNGSTCAAGANGVAFITEYNSQ